MSTHRPRSQTPAPDSRSDHASVINFGVVSLQIPPSSICRLSAVVLWKIEKQIEFACNPPQPSANANSLSRSAKQLCSRPGGHADLHCRMIDGASVRSSATVLTCTAALASLNLHLLAKASSGSERLLIVYWKMLNSSWMLMMWTCLVPWWASTWILK